MKTAFLSALLAVSIPAAGARADVVTYVVDPERSVLTLSGEFIPEYGSPRPITGQFSGLNPPELDPLITSYAGTITVIRDPSTMQIIEGSVTAHDNGLWLPSPSPGNYGILASVPTTSGYFILGGITDLSFSVFSNPLTESEASPGTYHFDDSLSFLRFSLASGELDFEVTKYSQFGGQQPQGAHSSHVSGHPVLAPGSVLLTSDGARKGLTIPIEMNFIDPIDITSFGDAAFAYHLSGTIVAVANVPEPASLILLTFPAFLLFGRRKSRHPSKECHL